MIMNLILLPVDDHQEPLEATELPVVIGRSCDVHLRVMCRWASRRHCEIDCVDEQFVLRDLGSRYGTIVNGQPVQQAVLHAGDEIRVGLKRFVVELVDNLIGTDRDGGAQLHSEPF
jgi:pSer/pThr/pTyr-binding forkhead associated (FHA) protein